MVAGSGIARAFVAGNGDIFYSIKRDSAFCLYCILIFNDDEGILDILDAE
jgi:hypothetical protein